MSSARDIQWYSTRYNSEADLFWPDGIFKNIPVAVDDVTKAYSTVPH